jgi:amino acid permease
MLSLFRSLVLSRWWRRRWWWGGWTWPCSTIGVGILALPRTFALVGWATATIALLLFSVLCLATFSMLAIAMRSCNVYTFGGLMRATAGPWTSEMTDAIIFLFLFGVQVIYTQVTAAIMVDLLGDWDALPMDDDSWFDNRRFFVVVFGLGAFWPLSLFPKMHFLK